MHFVTAPLVLVKDPRGRVTYVYEGHSLPEWTDTETIERLLSDRLITEPGGEAPAFVQSVPANAGS